MHRHDQSGFDNQPSELVSARDAAELLGVKPATLYAYASRGLLTSLKGDSGRARLYRRDELARLKTRHDARAGHAAVAASALRWGEPVLESSLTLIDERGPVYRGQPAVALAASVGLESVAELLWSGELPATKAKWHV